MKKIIYYVATTLAVVLASCSSGQGPKMISPTSTEFPSGELARYVEIVNEPSELSYAEKDGAIPTQYIRLKVKLKMVKDGFKDVDAQDIDFTGLLSVAVVKLVDNNGVDVQELSVKYEELLKLKKLLTGNEGDTEVIVFEGEFHNSEDAPNWFNDAAQFTPYLAADISATTSASNETEKITEYSNEETVEESEFGLDNVILPSALKDKVEAIHAEKSVGSYGFPTMEITFKLLSTVNTAPLCSEYGQMWIVGVGQTENGVDVKELLPNYREWRSGDSDGSEFKAFLEQEPGETITLEFTGSKDESDDVESDLEKVRKFKLKITN